MKTREEVIRRINETNEAFNNADAATKRVMLAQDVLDRIEAKQFIPDYHIGGIALAHYSDPNGVTTTIVGKRDDVNRGKGSIKEFLDCIPTSQCALCAKGGMFMAYIGRINNFDWLDLDTDTNHSSSSVVKLLEIFSEKQLSMMETFYEGNRYIINDKDGNGLYAEGDSEKIYMYRRSIVEYVYDCKEIGLALMTELCLNIIQNNGTFIIEGVDPETVYAE